MDICLVKKILIVDDEKSILLSLYYLLQTEGVGVVTCDEVSLAEEALARTHFDLVITDMHMSGASGLEGLELLTFIKERYPTEVIVMTGNGTAEIEKLSYERGALHFFTKPLDVRELLVKVDGIGIPIKMKPDVAG